MKPEVSDLLLLHDANAAIPGHTQVFVVAQGRDVDIEVAGCFKDGGTFINSNVDTVYGEIYLFSHNLLCYFLVNTELVNHFFLEIVVNRGE